MRIHLRGGRLIDPKNGVDAQQDLFIAAGKIVAIGREPEGFHANRVIDASGKIVCPGLVDVAARLREPGFEYKATLESEMAAAVAGGVTSLACLPDTDPPLDEPGLVEMLKHRARQLNQAHVYPIGALTVGLKGEQLTRVPRGFLPDHPAADLLRHKQFLASKEYPAAFASDAGFYPELLRVFRAITPLTRFLNDAVMPAPAPVREFDRA